MPQTIPAPTLHQTEVGYTLVAMLSAAAQSRVMQLSDGLHQLFPDALWQTPRPALHITLFEMFQPIDYGADKTALFDQAKHHYLSTIHATLTDVAPIMVNFDTVEASPGAVIIKGRDEGQFNTIRDQLTAQLPLPAGTRQPPSIIHSTVLRYRQAVDLVKIQAAASEHHIALREPVTAFILAKCTVQPLLQYETIATFPLRG